jgi:3-methyladenine DNA glycosylase AlkD
MEEKEDLVQKGFGWLLKEESRTKQKEVYEYVLSKRAVMPRTALRYAIELMPQDMRREAMKRIKK